MPIQIRVVETTTSRGHADVDINDTSPERAAAIIAKAHGKSVEAGSALITLPDGQTVLVEQGEPRTELTFILLDEDGQEVRPIDYPRQRRVRARRE